MPSSSESAAIDPRGTAALVSTLLEALQRSDAVTSGGLIGLPLKIGVSIEPGSDGTTAVTVEVKGRPAAEATLDRSSRPAGDGTIAGLEWNRPGHGVVAFIAMQRLGQTHPAIATAVETLLEKDPRGRTSVADLAAWPDTIKTGAHARPETAPWHYVDIPFDVDDPAAPPQLPAGPSLLTAIPAQIDAFNHATSVQDRLDALAFVFHLMGDLHQPLHCATRISPQHPQGDRGGNSFAILGPRVKDDRGHSNRLTNLHAFWDAALNIRGPADMQQKAVQLVAAHPPDRYADRLAITDVAKCALEGFGVAKSAVYTGIEENPAAPPEPSKTYIKRAIQVAADQGLVAGYRLADLLAEQLAWDLASNGVRSQGRRKNGTHPSPRTGRARITA
jgi:hypothetical protein